MPIVIYTNVSVDGTLQGVDLDSLQAVARAFGGDVIYSGGVGSLDDIAALTKLRHRGLRGVIVGRALYSGKFTLPQAIASASATRAYMGDRRALRHGYVRSSPGSSVGARRKIQMSQAMWLVISAGMLIPSARSSPQ